jgi:hypothetical protein
MSTVKLRIALSTDAPSSADALVSARYPGNTSQLMQSHYPSNEYLACQLLANLVNG